MHTSNGTVCVTGATGFVGRYVVRALEVAGCPVRALVRSHDNAGVLPEGDGVTRVTGDLFSPGVLDELVTGAHALVHCVGIRREFPAQGVTFERMHESAMKRVVEAAERAGIQRVVLISALGTRPDADTDYHRSKWAAEQILRDSDLDWTILRPSIIHGPDGELMQMVKGWVLGRSSPRVFLPYFTRVEGLEGFPPRPKLVSADVQPVAVEDVAGAVVAALQTPSAVGEVYPLVGPETLDWPTLLRSVRDALPMGSKKKPVVGLPAQAGVALARGASMLGLADALPFGPSEPTMASEDSTANPAKAADHLGLHPRPFIETMKAYADSI